MGDLALDTAVEGGDGRYTATFNADWNIWGPNGGYVAAVALRAAGAHCGLARPASLLVHFLGVARFEEVDVEVTTLRAARRAASVRVAITQRGAPIAEAMVWAVADELAGLAHDATSAPPVPPPDQLPDLEELLASEGPRPHGFWVNLERRPERWLAPEAWEARTTLDPTLRSWCRFRPSATFDDPWIDACRHVVLVDTFQWPSATGAYRGQLQYLAPSLDLSVSFHHLDPAAEWLLVDAHAPLARDGLVAGTAKVWSPSGALLASGSQQMLCKPIPG
jgi:acyl-CoA thioesterase